MTTPNRVSELLDDVQSASWGGNDAEGVHLFAFAVDHLAGQWFDDDEDALGAIAAVFDNLIDYARNLASAAHSLRNAIA